MNVTMSALPRALACLGSSLLPQVESPPGPEAHVGTSGHRFLRRVQQDGEVTARYEITDDDPAADIIRDLDVPALFAKLGVTGEQARVEAAVAYDVETGAARWLGGARTDERRYEGLGQDEIAGQLDVTWDKREIPLVVDWKFGASIGDPAESAQLKAYGLAVARVTASRALDVAAVYIRPGNEVYVSRRRLGPLDLDAFAADLRAWRARLAAAQTEAAQFGMTPVVEGEHCRFCRSFVHCPSKRNLALAIAGQPGALGLSEALTPERAGAAWSAVKDARALLDRVESAVREMVARGEDVVLPSGKVLRLAAEERVRIDAQIAFEAADREGYSAADVLAEMTLSKTGLERAVGKEGAATILGVVGELGGLHVETVTKLREVKAR